MLTKMIGGHIDPSPQASTLINVNVTIQPNGDFCDKGASGKEIGPVSESIQIANSEPDGQMSPSMKVIQKPRYLQPTIRVKSERSIPEVSPKIVSEDQLIGLTKRKRGQRPKDLVNRVQMNLESFLSTDRVVRRARRPSQSS